MFARAGASGPIIEIQPNPGATPMLFYPGTMLAPGHYSTLLGALRESGFATAALHLSGHGLNRRARLSSFSQLLDEGLTAEKWLRERGYGQACVCGHSQGGILALAHAAAASSSPAFFAICAAFPQAPEAIGLTTMAPLRKWRKRLLASILGAARALPRLPVPMPFYVSPGKVLAGKRPPLAMGCDRGRLAYPLEFLASLFSSVISGACRGSFHLFAARNDALFSPAITRKTFNRVQAGSKKLVWLEDGGHMAPMNPRLSRFIAKTAASACAGLGLPIKTGGAAR